jgi:hypothetical protein
MALDRVGALRGKMLREFHCALTGAPMNVIRKSMSLLGSITVLALLLIALAPRAARAVAAAQVEVMNPASSPVITSDIHLSPRIPVELPFCIAFGFFTCSGSLSSQMTVPASVTSANGLTITNPLLVIENQSANCTQVGNNTFGVQYNRNVSTSAQDFVFPLAPTGSLSNTFFYTSNQQTTIYFVAGDSIEMEPSGTAATNVECYAYLFGYYTAQP